MLNANAAERSDADDHVEPEAGPRIFLVVVDNSTEMRVALRFACTRALHTGGRVALLHVVEPAEFQHWLGVGNLMQQESREEGEALLQRCAAEVMRLTGTPAIYYMRDGEYAEQLFKLIEEDGNISIVVLAASDGQEGPGPIISHITSKGMQTLRIPITIVPGSLTDETIAAIA